MRHGHAPERTIRTGIGPIAVQRPRVRDRAKNIEELLPWLYLKSISTGQFGETLALAFVFKLTKLAERHWRLLNGSERLAGIIEGVRFRDGEPATRGGPSRCLSPSPNIDHSPANTPIAVRCASKVI